MKVIILAILTAFLGLKSAYPQENGNLVATNGIFLPILNLSDSLTISQQALSEVNRFFEMGYLEANATLVVHESICGYHVDPGPIYVVDSIVVDPRFPEPQARLKNQFGISKGKPLLQRRVRKLEKAGYAAQWEVVNRGVWLYVQVPPDSLSIDLSGNMGFASSEGELELQGELDLSALSFSQWGDGIDIDWKKNTDIQHIRAQAYIKSLFFLPIGFGIQLEQNIRNADFRQQIITREMIISPTEAWDIRFFQQSNKSFEAEVATSYNQIGISGMWTPSRKSQFAVRFSRSQNEVQLGELEFSGKHHFRHGVWGLTPQFWHGRKTGNIQRANYFHQGGYSTIRGVQNQALDFKNGSYLGLEPQLFLSASFSALLFGQFGFLENRRFSSYGLGMESVRNKRKFFILFALSTLERESSGIGASKLHFGWKKTI